MADRVTIKALETYAKELRSLLKRYKAKRARELEKFKPYEAMTEYEIQDAYGYGEITLAQYHRLMAHVNNTLPIDVDGHEVTEISEVIRILGNNIYSCESEIKWLQDEKKSPDGGNRQGPDETKPN